MRSQLLQSSKLGETLLPGRSLLKYADSGPLIDPKEDEDQDQHQIS